MNDETILGPGWYDGDTSTFGDRMAGAREAAGLSQSELAKRLGVKIKTIRAWENDMNEPRANKLQMLAGILGVSIMWLLTGEGDGVEPPEQDEPIPSDVQDLLLELRTMRSEQAKMADRMGRLEKRLRTALAGMRG